MVISSKYTLKKILKKGFVRNVVTLATGAAFAQIITIALSPLITRLYGPEAFGLLGTFNSLVIIVSTIAALTYPLAIVIPKEDSQAKTLFKLSLLVGAILSIITTIIILFFGKQISVVFNVENLFPYLFLIPFILFFSAGRQAAEQWLIRKKQFKITARISIIQSIVLNISKVIGGLINPIGAVLIFIATFGHAFYMGMLMWSSKEAYTGRKVTRTNNYKKLITIAKSFSEFPIYRSPQVLIAAITQSMPVLVLAATFGPIAAGFYTLSMTVLALPSQLIGKAVGDVFYPRIAEAVQNKENLNAILKKATISLGIVGMIPFGTIIVFGPSLFDIIFGGEWIKAGEYASWVSLWSYTLFISNPSIKALSVISAQKFYLLFTILNILIRGSFLLVGGLIFDNDVLAIALYSVSGALLSVMLILMTNYKCSKIVSGK